MAVDAGILDRLQRAAAALLNAAKLEEDKFVAALERAQAKMFERVAEIVSEVPVDAAVRQKLSWYGQNLFTRDGRIDALVRRTYLKGAADYVKGYEALAELNSQLNLLARNPVGAISGFAKMPAELIRAIQKRDLSFFEFLGARAVKELDNTLLDELLTATSRSSLLGTLRSKITGTYKWGDRLGMYEWHAGTYARTAHIRFSRQLDAFQAEKYEANQFVYLGPLDASTRTFCASRVGKVFTRAEIADMRNNQTADVFTDGGGWNCRHKWIAVSPEVAKALQGEAPAGPEEPALTLTPEEVIGAAEKPGLAAEIAKTMATRPVTWEKPPEFKKIGDAKRWAKKNLKSEIKWNHSKEIDMMQDLDPAEPGLSPGMAAFRTRQIERAKEILAETRKLLEAISEWEARVGRGWSCPIVMKDLAWESHGGWGAAVFRNIRALPKDLESKLYPTVTTPGSQKAYFYYDNREFFKGCQRTADNWAKELAGLADDHPDKIAGLPSSVSDDLRSMVFHEGGHEIDHGLLDEHGVRKLARIVQNMSKEDKTKLYRLSRYARYKISEPYHEWSEAIAEAFAEVANNGPRMKYIPEALLNEIKAILNMR